jgi:hypothetical protein
MDQKTTFWFGLPFDLPDAAQFKCDNHSCYIHGMKTNLR